MSYRWNPYVMFKNDEVSEFWKKHFEKQRKTLFILGLGFDVRMNKFLKILLESNSNMDLHCMLINFSEGKDSPSLELMGYVNKNKEEFFNLIPEENIIQKYCEIWSSDKKKKKRTGDRSITDSISPEEIQEYTDIIVDISSLPRGIFFSLIGKILAVIDEYELKTNFFVCTSENTEIDNETREKIADTELNYVHGFAGGIEQESQSNMPLVWFPILGEHRKEQFRKVWSKISELRNREIEVCPTLPFPSKNPRRSDNIINQYHDILFDELAIESQNITYIPEASPFEVYIRLNNGINNFKQSLKMLGGCKIILSIFSSKLIALGALLSAYEHSDDVGILNVDYQGYEFNDKDTVENLAESSELFVTWLTGEPFEN